MQKVRATLSLAVNLTYSTQVVHANTPVVPCNTQFHYRLKMVCWKCRLPWPLNYYHWAEQWSDCWQLKPGLAWLMLTFNFACSIKQFVLWYNFLVHYCIFIIKMFVCMVLLRALFSMCDGFSLMNCLRINFVKVTCKLQFTPLWYFPLCCAVLNANCDQELVAKQVPKQVCWKGKVLET